ncbi:MAG: N-acetylneuraminate synthase family protein, partial [Candidatus Staskawiczbacteria bacterium]
ELSDVNFRDLKKYCDSKKIVFLSTPYDEKSADFLEKLGVSAFKISSSDLTHLPLLKHVAKKRLPIIISTGASNLNEVNLAVKCVKAVGNKNIILLHCTAAYPTMIKDVNLNQMLTLKKNFKSLSAGYSDHTLSVLVPAMAVALGACIIEKHFTLDRNFIGPDHKASMEPEELRQIVKNIRDAESALGSSLKEPCKIEYEDRELGRRSIVAGVDIKKGEKIKENMLAIKRPGTGVEPKNLGKIIGKTAKEDIKKDSLIKYKSIK